MTTATDAFQSLLRTLCLQEFPCGNGSWRKQNTVRTIPLNYGKKVMKMVDKTEPQFSITLKEYDASKTHIESLQELVSTKHSPWTFDYSWSEEAKSLREIAVKSPEFINDDFIHQHFITLRLTDKGITEVDESLLKFTNLEYLTLSANYIKNVNSRNLPRKLLSLELNSNMVSELFSLCVDPPALVHLGLGNNCLTYVDDYLSGDHWPTLLSLDLSYNNLTDLPETLRKLKTLPNLRNIIMMGNPLMLTPGYRGFVVDNLKKIDLLDDVRIEADERHRFHQMSKLTEQELCQCKVTFEVGMIKNAPKPIEFEHPDEQPEYPIITRNYYLEFHYIDEGGADMDLFGMNQDNGLDFNPFSGVVGGGGKGGMSSAGITLRDELQTPMSNPMSVPMSDNLASSHPRDTFFTEMGDGGGIGSLAGGDQPVAAPVKKTTNIIRTEKGPWSPEIELNWNNTTKREDLLAVRDYFKKPMRIDVVEETILSYPKDEEGSEKQVGSAKKKKEEPKKEEKKGKKKKEPDQDMRQEPPELNVLATFEVNLDEFLTGESVFTKSLIREGAQSRLPSSVSQRPVSGGGGKKDKPRVKSGEKKDVKSKDQKSKDPPAKPGKGSGKKEGGKKKEAVEVEADPDEPPPALEVDITIRMHRWFSTKESIDVEE